MNESVSIPTPDRIHIEFELAGLGSRALAFMIDCVLIVSGLVLFAIVLVIAGLLAATDPATLPASAWAVALFFIVLFLGLWGYFLLFEALDHGRTPGKRLAGIRVVRDDGFPVGWREAALRNLVRAADMIPPPACLVGSLTMALSKNGSRLGDLVAGTMVVREDFGTALEQDSSSWEAAWIVRAESGGSRRGVTLADLRIEPGELQVIEKFLARAESLPKAQRRTLAWRIAQPFLGALGEDPVELAGRPDRYEVAERILWEISRKGSETAVASVSGEPAKAAEAKRRQWMDFEQRIVTIGSRGKRGLRSLEPAALRSLIHDYHRLGCDLARARSIAPGSTMERRLNQIAARAHHVIYGHIRPAAHGPRVHWATRFPLAVRSHLPAVALSVLLFFGPAVVSYIAVQLHPEYGYDLVGPAFLDFEPAREESLHDIPGIARPIAASQIMTNNLQVTLLAFGLGLTAGIGTCLLLVFNGVYLGAVAGWMTARGSSRALWGWIMPHGGTELLAITLAGAAGFVLARAIIAPGEVPRATALRNVALGALTIELGVMVMLVVAGLIEGFVSPSSIGFGARIGVLALTLTFWLAYLALAGMRSTASTGRRSTHTRP